jgi:lipid-binding SYLF domain-containing protein
MKVTLVVLVMLGTTCHTWAESSAEKAEKRLQAAAQVLQEIMSAPDKGIPEEVMEGAKCIAVIPHEIKGGLVFGVAHGKGVATCRTANGWSSPEFFSVTGGSWGAQIGVEGVDNVLMIMNQKGMDRLLASKFQIGGEASAAAGPVGRHAAAGTDWKLDTEILSYSRAKGVFAGVTLNGTWVSPDTEAILAFYGREVSPKAILTGQVAAPPQAQTFLAAVRDAEKQTKKQSHLLNFEWKIDLTVQSSEISG